MTRPRASTVLRRFLDGESIDKLTVWLLAIGMDRGAAFRYVEHCIRRGLRGEVRIPAARRPRRRSKP